MKPRKPLPSAATPAGQPRVGFGFTIAHGKIVAIELLADPDRLHNLDLVILDG